MRIRATGTSSMVSTSGRVPGPRTDDAQQGRRDAWVVRGGSTSPEVVLIGSGEQVAVAIAVAELLSRDGVEARVVALSAGHRPQSIDPDEIDGVAPSGVPRVAVCGDGCPETLEGIRLSAHDAIAAGTQGW